MRISETHTLTTVLPSVSWIPLAHAHAERADEMTAGHRARRANGEKHAIEDFLYDYYGTRPAQLRRWHPGVGTGLAATPTGPAEHAAWKWYKAHPDGVVALDVEAYMHARGESVRYIHGLLTATASRPVFSGCFGLHEWAMVYRADETRHDWPLRLGPDGTDAVVESHRIGCSHFDAFRFFTPDARPLNTLSPARDDRPAFEQPGCLHAGMDLYKHAFRLTPMICSDLVADCFELARDIRELDMRAAPYDLRDLGFEPLPIETPEGKTAYVEAQRDFARRGAPLRARLVAECDRLLDVIRSGGH